MHAVRTSVSSLSVLWRNSLHLMRTLRHACIICICSVEEFSPTHANVEACLYPLSVLWRNSLQLMRTQRHACILSVCSMEELSPTHADVVACLYPLYLFHRGILSNSCGRRSMHILCICSIEEFSLTHADVEACLYPLCLCYRGTLSNSCGLRGMPVSSLSVLQRNSLQLMRTQKHACILSVCSIEELSPTHADVEACLYPLCLFYRGTLSNSCGLRGMPVSSLSVLQRNSLQLMRTQRHACILSVCSIEELSPTHVDVQACLYPLYVFCGGILSALYS